MQPSWPIIKSATFLLRPIRPTDDQAIFEAFTDVVCTYLPVNPPANIAGTRAFIRQAEQDSTSGKELVMVIEGLERHQFLGCCGLHKLTSGTPEIGIWLAEHAQNQGLGSQVVEQLIQHGKTHLSIQQFSYPVAKDNHRSIALVKKIGGYYHRNYILRAEKTLEVLEYRIEV